MVRYAKPKVKQLTDLSESEQEQVIQEIARIITTTLDIEVVYEKFALAVKKLVPFDRIFINVVDQDTSQHSLKYVFGLDSESLRLGQQPISEDTHTYQVITNGQPLIQDDIGIPYRFGDDEENARLGFRSSIALPLVSKGSAIGTLCLRSCQTGTYGLRELGLLQRVAEQIAPAVENAHLYQQLRDGSKQIAMIDEVARIVTSTLDIGEVYERFIMEVRKLINFDHAAINIIDSQNAEVISKHIYSDPNKNINRHHEIVRPLRGSFTEHLVELGHSLAREDVGQDTRFPVDTDLLPLGLRSSIGVPLNSHGKCIGSITLRSCLVGAFGQQERSILERLARQIAPAIENAELYQKLQESTEEMVVVDKIARIITSTLHVEDVYERFALEMQKLVDFDRVNITLIDRDSGTFRFKYVHGRVQADRHIGDVIPLAGSQTLQVMNSRESIIRQDILAAPIYAWDGIHLELGLRSSIMVPLFSKGEVIGTMSLRHRERGFYGPREKVILERMASQIAPAIINADLYQQVQVKSQEMELVDQVARIITSTLHIEQVCEEFTQQLSTLVDFGRASVSIANKDEGTFTLQYVFGYPQSGIPAGSVIPLKGNMTGHVVATGQTLVRQDIRLEPGFGDDQDHTESGLFSAIALPLISKGRVIGSMILRSHLVGAYGVREQAILERLASQIAPAIENAHLYDAAQMEKDRATTSVAQLRALLESVDSGILLVGSEQQALWANRCFEEFIGLDDVQSLILKNSSRRYRRELIWRVLGDPDKTFAEVDQVHEDPNFVGPISEVEVVRPVRRILQPFTTPVYDDDGTWIGRLWVFHDVTERKQAEAQILQFQKMETVGRLAGGVAHDFNNQLTAIMGFSELAMMDLPPDGPANKHVEEIQRASERASNLTAQLLAFSRRQVIKSQLVDLNELISGLGRMVQPLIGAHIELITLPAPDLNHVKVDPGQMEQVLMNMAVNARDAMPFGGKLLIQTKNVVLDAPSPGNPNGISSDDYVLLSITDTGMGMDEATKGHIFEPFFTTKPMEKGNGLGLATCYGVVNQCGGVIEVESEPGEGTTFKIYLPSVEGPPESTANSLDDHPPVTYQGMERVLLAEDDPSVRRMVVSVLRDRGYTVLEATNGVEALQVAENNTDGPIDLLLTDVMMPQMGGVELADNITRLYPGTKVLFTSGHTGGQILPKGTSDSEVQFLAKPFLPQALIQKVQQVLDD